MPSQPSQPPQISREALLSLLERLHASERAAVTEERALIEAARAAGLEPSAEAVSVARGLAEGLIACREALSAHLRATLRAPERARAAVSAPAVAPAADAVADAVADALSEPVSEPVSEPIARAPLLSAHTPVPAAFAIDETPVHEYSGQGVTPPMESRAPIEVTPDEDTPPPLPSEQTLASAASGDQTPLPWAPTPSVSATEGHMPWDFPMTTGEVSSLVVPSPLAHTPLPFAAPSPLPSPRADLSGARRLEASLDGDPTLEPTPTPPVPLEGARAVVSERGASAEIEAAWSALEEEGEVEVALDLGASSGVVEGAGYQPERALRVSLDVPVLVMTDVVSFNALCHNINTGGLFLETEVPLEVGEVVKVRLELERSGFELNARAAVRWRRLAADAAPGAPVGVGLSFTDLPAVARRHLEAYVASHS